MTATAVRPETIEGDFTEAARRTEAQQAAPLATVQPLQAEPPPRHFFDLDIDEQIARMTAVANKAKHVIDSRKWYEEFTNKRTGEIARHVTVEGWQFIGSLMRCTADCVSSAPLEGGGWEARAVLVRVDSGVRIGGGDGMCTKDEYNWKNRDQYAIRGMAQTRAISRTFRHAFAFVAELAGYHPTPAAEMPREDNPTAAARPMGERAPEPKREQPPQRTVAQAQPAPAGRAPAGDGAVTSGRSEGAPTAEVPALCNRFIALHMGPSKAAFGEWIRKTFAGHSKMPTGEGMFRYIKGHGELVAGIKAELDAVGANEAAS